MRIRGRGQLGKPRAFVLGGVAPALPVAGEPGIRAPARGRPSELDHGGLGTGGSGAVAEPGKQPPRRALAARAGGAVSLASALRAAAAGHLEGGGSLGAPGLWQALAGTLVAFFGEALSQNLPPKNPAQSPLAKSGEESLSTDLSTESTARGITPADRAAVEQFLDWLERLAALESRAKSLQLRAGTGGKAEEALKEWRQAMAEMLDETGPRPAEEVEELEGPAGVWNVPAPEPQKEPEKDLTRATGGRTEGLMPGTPDPPTEPSGARGPSDGEPAPA
jgi:hypothetical protein